MDPTKKPDPASEPQAGENEEEVIDLTEVMEEGASETVIEISAKMDDLDSLDLKSLLSEAAETGPAAGSKQEEEASLEDLLSSLKEPAGEPFAAAEPEPIPVPEPPPPPAPEPPPPPEVAAAPLAAAAPEAEVRQQVQAALSEDLIRQIVREVVQEIAEKLCREMFPEVASAEVSREIAALKKSLEEEI